MLYVKAFRDHSASTIGKSLVAFFVGLEFCVRFNFEKHLTIIGVCYWWIVIIAELLQTNMDTH